MLDDILERLRVDPGLRTLGLLLQDREAAAHEIRRLRSEVDRLRIADVRQHSHRPRRMESERTGTDQHQAAFHPGSLLRLADVCKMLGLSRSSIYNRLSEGNFPKPVRLGIRAVRWRVDAIEAWRDSFPN
jgi:prophage regulatory protein